QRQGADSIRAMNPAVSPALAGLIEKCLAFDAADRFSTAAELAAAIRRAITLPRRALRWASRHPWTAALGALLVTSVPLGAVGYHQFREPPHQIQINAGLAHFDAGRYGEAVSAFD